MPGRRRKLVTATGYSPTSDRGESNLEICKFNIKLKYKYKQNTNKSPKYDITITVTG